MKPTCRQILDILRQAKGNWVRNEFLPAIGGNRFGGRIKDLRDAGYQIEARSCGGGRWEYRLAGEPDSHYDRFTCPSCQWEGPEPKAIRAIAGFHCPVCSAMVTAVSPPGRAEQTGLFSGAVRR